MPRATVCAALGMPTIEYVNAYVDFLTSLASDVAARGATLLILGDSPRTPPTSYHSHRAQWPTSLAVCVGVRELWSLAYWTVAHTAPCRRS